MMARSCCPTCRLRFSRETAAHLTECPFCGRAPELLPAGATLGFRQFAVEVLPVPDVQAQALALSMEPVDPGGPHA
jgi:hypothetical protein